jgi:hypothetical protein
MLAFLKQTLSDFGAISLAFRTGFAVYPFRSEIAAPIATPGAAEALQRSCRFGDDI